jgi:hypothetical protein
LQNKIIGRRVSGKSDLKRGCDGRRHRCVPADVAPCALVLHMIEEVRFAFDSPLEGTGFEPSVPLKTPGALVISVLVRRRFRWAGNQAEAT